MVEFNEKLQQLRKSRSLTQEELAEALFVSRAAVSKWESGRGYPSIDSLKDISVFFSVTVDELLSGEKLLSIAEKENVSNIRNMCELLFGFADLLSLALIALPLYPNVIDGYVYSVSLLEYTQATPLNKTAYWAAFLSLVATGLLKIILTKIRIERGSKTVTVLSLAVSILAVVYLAAAREAYAAVVAFLLLVINWVQVVQDI